MRSPWIVLVIEGITKHFLILFWILIACLGSLDVAVELTVKVLSILSYVEAVAYPVVSPLNYILLNICSMDNDNTCFAGLMIKASYQNLLFSLLNAGSYSDFFQIFALGYFFESFISWRASSDVTAP